VFTGIVEDVGTVARVAGGRGGGKTLWIRTDLPMDSIAIGDSISTSGVCLTVTQKDGVTFSVDAGPETLARTTIGELTAGMKVNLERSCTLQTRLGGHLVQGHVDAVGAVRSIVPHENAHDFVFEAPPEVLALTVPRGSIAIDGISLTVTGRTDETFSVMIIPHTFAKTTLGSARPGTRVNLEVDMIARYVAGLLDAYRTAAKPGLTQEFLEKHGF
jgi:riboflavin synthase